MPQGDTLQVQDILNRAFDSTLNALKVAGGGGVSQFVSTIHNIVGGNVGHDGRQGFADDHVGCDGSIAADGVGWGVGAGLRRH